MRSTDALMIHCWGKLAVAFFLLVFDCLIRIFTASTWQEGEWHIAQCVEVDVASQGATEDESLENLRDALELHFTPPVATITPPVRHIEVDIKAA